MNYPTPAPAIMSNITIEVWDATGNKKQLVELPADAPVNRVIAVLVEKMNLPRYSPDNQLMSYKFQHRASGRQLLDEETLASAGVQHGDIVRLQPEITAGSYVYCPRARMMKRNAQARNGNACLACASGFYAPQRMFHFRPRTV